MFRAPPSSIVGLSLFRKTVVGSLRVNSPIDCVDILLQSESEVVEGIERSSFPRLNALLRLEYRLPKILFVSRKDVFLFPIFLPFVRHLDVVIVAVTPFQVHDDFGVIFGLSFQFLNGVHFVRRSREHGTLQNVVYFPMILHDVRDVIEKESVLQFSSLLRLFFETQSVEVDFVANVDIDWSVVYDVFLIFDAFSFCL